MAISSRDREKKKDKTNGERLQGPVLRSLYRKAKREVTTRV